MKKYYVIISSCCLLFFGYIYASEKMSPVGRWETIDDKTHDVASIVNLWLDDSGLLHGKIEKVIIKPGEDPQPVCKKCTDEKKNKPLVGMEILWDFKQEKKDDPTKWTSGKILDPDEGNVYSCNLTMNKDGKSLEVRGFIGIPWIGRSQTWNRVENK